MFFVEVYFIVSLNQGSHPLWDNWLSFIPSAPSPISLELIRFLVSDFPELRGLSVIIKVLAKI